MNHFEIRRCLLYCYGNPAGTIKGRTARVDPLFKAVRLEQFLAQKGFQIIWQSGLFERLSKGGEAYDLGDENAHLKAVRIWQHSAAAPFQIRFIAHRALVALGQTVKLSHYQVCFDGQLPTNDLPLIYQHFHDHMQRGFSGHLLSISDLIELYDESERLFYYVDRLGFKQVRPEDAR